MLGFSNRSGGGGVGAEDLAQLQSTMRAIELACSYIQVYFLFCFFFLHSYTHKQVGRSIPCLLVDIFGFLIYWGKL